MARAGAARVFFDIVGTFQAKKLINDSKSAATVQTAIFMDAAANIADAFDDMATAILDSVGEITQAFFDYETQLIRVRKFYQGLEEEVNAFAAASERLGLAFGFTGEEALAASAKTAQLKQVLESQEAIIEATRGGLLMAAVGEMETEMGMNRLIQLAQQTGFMIGNLTKAQYDALSAEQQANVVRGNTLRVLDQLNTVENTSVATMEDITFVLNQFSSQAHIAGESIGEMAAMSALLLETGEEVSRAGTGLRMIYQRIGNENTQAVKVLQELMGGVDASTVTQTKLTDIIKQIAPAYANMTAEQKRNLAVSIAGSRHYVKFLKLMENQERLLELQESAYHGVYGAIDEFNNKANTSVFEMQQLQALTQNLRVELGDNLADAYIKAEVGTLRFLEALHGLSETDYGGNAMENVIILSGMYQNLIAPFANVGFQVINLAIAFRTLGAVQRAMSAEALMARNDYQVLAAQTKVTKAAHNEMSVNFQTNVNMNQMKLGLFRNEINSAASMTGMYQRELQGLVVQSSNYSNIQQKMTAQAQQLSAGVAVQRNLNVQNGQTIVYSTGALADLSMRLEQMPSIIAKVGAMHFQHNSQLQKFIGLNAGAVQGTMTYNSLMQGGLPALQKRMQAQQDLINARAAESAAMSSELQILIPLNAEEQKRATIQIKENNTLIEKLRIEQGLLQSHMARLRLQGLEDAESTERITTIQTEITALRSKNLAMEQDIMASRQAIGAVEAHSASMQKQKGIIYMTGNAFRSLNASVATLGVTTAGVTKILMPVTLILPMITDGAHSMKLMMGGMAAMMLVKAVPAMMSYLATLRTGISLQAGMSGGLTLLAAGAAMAAGYFLADSFMPDDFLSEPLENLNEFNDGLETMEGNLSALVANTDVILAGIVDNTIQDFIEAPHTIAGAIGDIQKEINDLQSVKGTGTDAFNADIEARIKAAEGAKKSLEDLTGSMEQHAHVNRQLEAGASGGGSISSFYEKHYLIDTTGSDQVTKDIVGSVQAFGYYDDDPTYRLEYRDSHGNFIEEIFDDEDEANERLKKLNADHNHDALTAQKRFYDAMFGIEEDAANASLNLITASNEQTMGEMFKFANAKEELFFGQRQNFTGALYKQVAQGGIENLLHKTEIIQTNVFNGMTLPEMVSKVADGVLVELDNRGFGA